MLYYTQEFYDESADRIDTLVERHGGKIWFGLDETANVRISFKSEVDEDCFLEDLANFPFGE